MYIDRFVRVSESPLLTSADYNWPIGHDTIMFPCVVDVGDKIASPLAHYYLYLAAHGGKGIMLALADEPAGPWRMYRGNPVYTLDMAIECRGHLSSPNVVWVPEKQMFYLYYHGPSSTDGRGQHTGLALSRDGLSFEPWKANPIIPNGPEGSWTSAMAAYLRVFRFNCMCILCPKYLTFDGWQALFHEAGVRDLKVIMDEMGRHSMLREEGLLNTVRVMSKWLSNPK